MFRRLSARSDIASRDRLPSLTGLRFWAALLVVLYHLTRQIGEVQPLSAMALFGRSGVTFFFVLSGFVLAWTYASASVSLSVFWWRRLARLWPLVAITGILSLGAYWSLGTQVPPARAASTFLFLQAWRKDWAAGANPAAWSLSDEAFFYLLFPALLVAASQPRVRALLWVLTLLALPVLFGLAFTGDWLDARFDYLPLTRLPQFALGMLCGMAVRRGLRIRLALGPAVALVLGYHAGLYGLAQSVGQPDWLYSGSHWWAALPFAVLIVAAAQADLDRRRTGLGGTWSLRLGHWSFAWYLVHEIVIRVTVGGLGRPEGALETTLWWVLLLLGTQAVAAVLYTLVEHPAERWLRARGPQPPRVGLDASLCTVPNPIQPIDTRTDVRLE